MDGESKALKNFQGLAMVRGSYSGYIVLNRHKMFSILFSNIGQSASRVGKHVGRPARRRLGRAEIEQIRLLRSQGKSVRQLAKEFGASQWMIAKLEPAA
jgi:hypothetical protein